MNILAIETSCHRASCAISGDKKILSFVEDEALNMQAENLFRLIDKSFVESNLSYPDINYIAVTKGPGSFTGIRIGLSAVKGILFAARNISPITCDNFEVMASRVLPQVSSKVQNILIVLKASLNSVYISTFDLQLNSLENQVREMFMNELLEYIQSFKLPIAISGNGLDFVIKVIKLQNKCLKNIVLLPRFSEINARSLILAAHYFLKHKKISQDINPLYVKLPSARPVS